MKPDQRVYTSLEEVNLAGGPPVVLTIGTFDGVHLAHRQLLDEAVLHAGKLRGLAATLTFRNHPRAIVSPDNCPPLLTDWESKRALILKRRVDILIGLEFSPDFARTSAEKFIRETIAGRLNARHVISGPDFHFGHGGKGNAALLDRLSGELGYTYTRRDPVVYEGEKVSSTRIRAALAAGDVALAARLLVRPHRTVGRVVKGDGIGRKIGFPTANLAVHPNILIPADGVYAVRVRISDETGSIPGMMNIGWRPTFGGKDHRIEVHLIGWKGNLEGKQLAVDFMAHIRSEKRFDGMEELKFQLSQDRQAVLEALEE